MHMLMCVIVPVHITYGVEPGTVLFQYWGIITAEVFEWAGGIVTACDTQVIQQVHVDTSEVTEPACSTPLHLNNVTTTPFCNER